MTAKAAQLMGLHALTPLHPGAGTALGVVDLPIQRERHTQWPIIPGSALKGILRDECRENSLGAPVNFFDGMSPEDEKALQQESQRTQVDASAKVTALFGPPTQWASEFAGALSVTDARLVAFPVRSMRGVFAWVTCGAVLSRLANDVKLTGGQVDWNVPGVERSQFLTADGCQCVYERDGKKYVVLEEFDYTAAEPDAANTQKIADWLSNNLIPAGNIDNFSNQFVILSNDDFTHFAKHATEVAARIKLNYETKTVDGGALFYQEFLPAESLLYSVVIANTARSRGNGSATEAASLLSNLRELIPAESVLQVGADETTGKGLCSVRFTETVA